jgi:hypothetical protein
MWMMPFSRAVVPVSVGMPLEVIEIFGNGRAFGDEGSVFEFQHRQRA